MKLLQIDSSARAGSVTRRLTSKFAKEWRSNHPTGEVIQRDLSTTILPLITDDSRGAVVGKHKVTVAWPAQERGAAPKTPAIPMVYDIVSTTPIEKDVVAGPLPPASGSRPPA